MSLRDGVILAARLAVLVAVIYGAIRLGAWVRDTVDMQISPLSDTMAVWLMVLALVVYALLLAVPFVPGAEIGISLMAVFGISVVPFVYLATVIGLTLAFLIGALIPPAASCRALRRAGLVRIADLVAQAHAARAAGDPARLLSAVQHPLAARFTRHRYIALALLINLPGNVVIGGGGGLALMAGLSGAFRTAAFVLTVALAVLPVPFAVYVLGYNI